jgi:hypothetical protein
LPEMHQEQEVNKAKAETKKLLVLDLFSGIWPHTMLVAKVAGQLDPSTFKLSYLSCGELFPRFCTVRESRKREIQQKEVSNRLDCSDCQFSARIVGRFLSKKNLAGSSTDFLSRYVTDLDRVYAEEIRSRVVIYPLDLDFELDGVPIVRYALFETLIKFKKLDNRLTDSENEYFQALLQNCILTVLSGRKYLESHQDFAAILIHSPEYGPNNCFAELARQRGIPVYSIRGSSNLAEMDSSVMIWRWDYRPEVPPHLLGWTGWQNSDISNADWLRLESHKKELLAGKSAFVYSSPFNSKSTTQSTKKKLGIQGGTKTIFMSLSSTDEIVASKTIKRGTAVFYPGNVFDDQFQWVSETISWVSGKPEIRLIVRPHPRDLPNKRDSILSEQHAKWTDLLRELPANVVVNHPDQQISFGEVCLVSDVLVTGWSSTAIEAMLLGKPVVTYDQSLPGFPKDIHLTGNSKEEYFRNLEASILDSATRDHAELANRWLTHFLVRGSIQLTGGLFSNSRISGPVIIRKIFSALDRYAPYIWRPLELWITFRQSVEANRINRLLQDLLPNVYVK